MVKKSPGSFSVGYFKTIVYILTYNNLEGDINLAVNSINANALENKIQNIYFF